MFISITCFLAAMLGVLLAVVLRRRKRARVWNEARAEMLKHMHLLSPVPSPLYGDDEFRSAVQAIDDELDRGDEAIKRRSNDSFKWEV